jgi:hypothetical protein
VTSSFHQILAKFYEILLEGFCEVMEPLLRKQLFPRISLRIGSGKVEQILDPSVNHFGHKQIQITFLCLLYKRYMNESRATCNR